MSSMLAADSVLIDVLPAFAPNGRPENQSPSWPQYVANATSALENHYASIGDRATDPTAYEPITTFITPLDMFYTTDFNSWRGQADPNPAFTGMPVDFQSETGNNVQFGLRIETDGVDFALADVTWQLDSDDLSNYFDAAGDFSAANYSATRVGINFGLDGTKGGGDDIVYKNNESGSLPVHQLFYVGVGEGFRADAADGTNNQEAVANIVRDLLTTSADKFFNLSAIYSLPDPLGGGSLLISSDSVEVQIPAGMGGDFNFDRDITAADKDLLTQATAAGTNDVLFDLNVDSLVNFADLEKMVHDIAGTTFGDANCNGVFNSTDLIQVMVYGLYETGSPAVWSSGDFDGNGLFESSDLILALADGGYDPLSAVAAVPEPATLVLTLIGLALVAARWRR
jgi:hypothetical protein